MKITFDRSVGLAQKASGFKASSIRRPATSVIGAAPPAPTTPPSPGIPIAVVGGFGLLFGALLASKKTVLAR